MKKASYDNYKILELAKKYKKKPNTFQQKEDGRIEWVCKHGIGHTVYGNDMTHCCDGCCIKLKGNKYRGETIPIDTITKYYATNNTTTYSVNKQNKLSDESFWDKIRRIFKR